VLRFERELVASLVGPDLEPSRRRAVEEFVDASLRSMPEHIRLGVAAETLVLGTWPLLGLASGRLDRASLRALVQRWGTSRLDPLRQYVRVFASLVAFAENELAA